MATEVALRRTSARGASRRLRVMHITPFMGTGGLERVIVTICKGIDRSRFDVSVLCLRLLGPLADELCEAGIPVRRLQRRPGAVDYFSFLEISRILREARIDVVHTHNTHAFLDGTAGAMLARVPTLVHTDHGRRFPDRMRYMIAEHVASRFAHRVVGVSDVTADNLHRFERIPRRKLTVVPNGIDAARFDVSIDRAAKRRELGLPPAGPILGMVARLTEEKGIVHLLRALALLSPVLPTAQVVVAGIGALEPMLRREAESLGVADRVWLIGERRDVPELLQLFDIYLLPSISEGLPIGLLEAMAAARPIIASAVGGIPGVIEPDRTGTLVPPADPRALADAILAQLSDDRLRRRLAQAARQRFRERFSATAMVRAYEALYERRMPLELKAVP